jgi:hypothetical protein
VRGVARRDHAVVNPQILRENRKTLPIFRSSCESLVARMDVGPCRGTGPFPCVAVLVLVVRLDFPA